MARASSALTAASSVRPVCRAISASRFSPTATQYRSSASRHSFSPSVPSAQAVAGSLDRVTCPRTTVAAPWTRAGTPVMSSARNERSHSPPSPNVPHTIQHGLTAAQIRSPASASPCSRHQFRIWITLPASTS